MKQTVSWLRPWLVPAALVAVAVVLTVPWSYFVLNAAYNRDVTENARGIARRVELQHTITNASLGMSTDLLFPFREEVRRTQLTDALKAEINSEPSIEALVFYAIRYSDEEDSARPQPVLSRLAWSRRKAEVAIPGLSVEDIETLKAKGMMYADDEATQAKRFFIPWVKEGRVRGVTYVVLSNDVLRKDFWKKEASLLIRVVAWSTTGVLALSAVGIFAYRAWRKAGHVQVRAELAQQGLLAERGLTAAVLAHEIRNPLQALRFQLHSLRKNANDPQRVGGTAETIDSELSRIQQLVTDYLEHEKAASMRVQSVDLYEAATTLKGVMDELLREHGTRLTIVPPGQPVRVTCDPHALRQVLMNLVLNAQQAMGDGGSITIRIGRDESGLFGTIEVTDTGPGIPEEMRARLFKPFQTSKAEGHGIGLALVKRFVDNFGGSVAVESEAGRGTTFRLMLPLAGTEGVAEPPADGAEAAPEGQRVGV